jgi:tripartite-type tricarboxylate transporter receptor subunit TctC
MMKSTFKQFMIAAAAGFAALTGAHAADDTYPSKPITILMGFAAGSATDAAIRLVAPKMSEALKVPVIVENRPGANQTVAINALRQSKPDGYTLYVGTGSTLAQNVAVNPDLTYKPLRDFSFVGTIGLHPGVLVARPGLPVKSVKELIAHMRSNPGKLNYVSAGAGSSNQLAMLYLMGLTKADMVHIPMKSDIQISLELAAERGDVAFQTAQTVTPFVKDNKLRALAVARKERLPYLPEVPTFAEAGLPEMGGIDPYAWAGLVGPAGMPEAIVTKLNQLVSQVVSSPEITTKLRDNLRMEPMIHTPESFRTYVEAETAKWMAMRSKITLEPK